MAEWEAWASCFLVFLAPKSVGNNAAAGPEGSCSDSGFRKFLQELLENLPKLCPRGRHYLYYSVSGGGTKNKQRLAISQGCFLDRYPWNKSRIKGVTKTKLKIAPQQNIVIEPHYSQFCTWQFTYSVNFMCNPKINTCPTFTVICRHGQSGKMLSCLTLRFSAKATQGNSLPSCFSFQAVIKCLFCRLLCFLHFCALFFFFGDFAI